jgi:hypothetical protein
MEANITLTYGYSQLLKRENTRRYDPRHGGNISKKRKTGYVENGIRREYQFNSSPDRVQVSGRRKYMIFCLISFEMGTLLFRWALIKIKKILHSEDCAS